MSKNFINFFQKKQTLNEITLWLMDFILPLRHTKVITKDHKGC